MCSFPFCGSNAYYQGLSSLILSGLLAYVVIIHKKKIVQAEEEIEKWNQNGS